MTTHSMDSVETGPGVAGMTEKQETAVSWGSSGLLHCGTALLIVFSFYALGKASPTEQPFEVIPIGDTREITDPRKMPGHAGPNDDPTRQVMLMKVKDVLDPGFDPDGLRTGDLENLGGMKGSISLDPITVGVGGLPPGGGGTGTFGNSGTGRPTIYGRDNSGGALFRMPVSTGRPPGKLVYVLDHSGSMIDTFDFLRQEVKHAIGTLRPNQQFAVVMFSEEVHVLGPKHLQRAHGDVVRDIQSRVDQVRAAGKNDDLLVPFKQAFETAFAMDPDVIVFLTDGKFDDHLTIDVAAMNKNKKVKINTIAYVRIEKPSEEQLKAIALDNGGRYKFVAAEDLGR